MVKVDLLSIVLSVGLFRLQAHASVESEYYQPSVSSSEPVKIPPVRAQSLFPHLAKRENDLSRFDLQHQVRLAWAGNSGGQRVVFDMKVNKPDPQHPLLSLEDLDDLTKSITCKEPHIELAFHTKNAMNRAIKAWDWINENESDYFFLIANHEGCGPEGMRHPYKVFKVKYDLKALTATLTTKETSWDDAAANHEVSFGARPHYEQPHSLDTQHTSARIIARDQPKPQDKTKVDKAKDLLRDEKQRFKDNHTKEKLADLVPNTKEKFIDGATKKPGILKTTVAIAEVAFKTARDGYKVVKKFKQLMNGRDTVFNLTSPKNLKDALIYQSGKKADDISGAPAKEDKSQKSAKEDKSQAPATTIHCDGCETQGTFSLHSRWEKNEGSIKNIIISGSPHGLKGKFALKLKLSETKAKKDILRKMFPFPVLSPFTIGIYTVGPSVHLGFGVEALLKTNANMVAGMDFTIPDTTNFEFHADSPKSSKAGGIAGASWTPFFRVDDLNIAGSVGVYGVVRVAIAITSTSKSIGVRGDFKFGVTSTLTAGLIKPGDCPSLENHVPSLPGNSQKQLPAKDATPAKKATTALKLGANINFEISGGIGWEKSKVDTLYKLYEAEWMSYGYCWGAVLPKNVELKVSNVVPKKVNDKVEPMPFVPDTMETASKEHGEIPFIDDF
ncbi:hypothetical protein TWF694_007663 [Orbilia ellipsospora]|uniref:DUF7029 domain-containing protein n=1 Tax=Orbilia ellipsospora TaxID=2528407 RepID=A0AAV9XJW8_9PEZI